MIPPLKKNQMFLFTSLIHIYPEVYAYVNTEEYIFHFTLVCDLEVQSESIIFMGSLDFWFLLRGNQQVVPTGKSKEIEEEHESLYSLIPLPVRYQG
jgi:hypothetical protein